MRTKKPVEVKLKDFSNYCMVDPVNEKCKKILNSNLDDDLKVELIGILQNPAPAPVITPYVTWSDYHPADSRKVEVTCNGVSGM